ncbi:uncharacterized protein MYCFIDRAFT_216407 [Pseudocercospora fijiensis CIRAD86]|uniref:Dynactin subunit n=1 Tax=Pseudocercospora fijiensis (strain CIRAD86) TaxID=383855 RepID=M3A3X9_PSEFD|nr:uncharacterized protein MYCFIDRAFT_216407 [Pseudocercospora fijiensis CIRAD86]EME79316.1 hypothetical protein MYCFIDRAFT_216407 [Pseudocercospora fijiensis CIRAD86]
MTTEGPHKLAQLPGYDTAPDVYETGDVTDGDTTTSTQQTHSQVPSEASDTSEEEDDTDSYGVSRRRLYPERARSRFGEQSRRLVTKGTDISDRVDGKRKGYRTRSRPRDVDEDETLEARIARLRKEIEECKAEAEAEKQEAAEGEDDDEEEEEGDGDMLDDCETLSRLLAGIDVPSTKRKGHRRRGSIFHDAPTTAPPATAGADQEDITDEQTLNKVSTFDSRLAALESSLGISALDSLTETPTTPILPSLTLLDHQLATLTSATNLSSLEHLSSRIQKLKLEAQTLAYLQKQSANGKPSSSHAEEDEDDDEEEEAPTLLTAEDMARLQSLYTLIPTLRALSPTIPALMTRLRSLRTLHTTAANASADLESLEHRQAEMEQELKMWREGLEKVEEAVKNADEANGRNGSTVKGWVDDLEKRVKALGR